MSLFQIRRFSMRFIVLALYLGGVAWADEGRRESKTYQKEVLPFLKKHCHTCHDEREAMAGFRIDELSTRFSDGKAGDQWVEVMDHLNLGTMPPEGEPRPDPRQSFHVVKWIAHELQRAEKEARMAGGTIPMRRLNRDEYANTIRDLLLIDEKLLAPIVEDLPGDGKAEGFDRLGVALLFDQTQIERSLAAAEKISELAIVNAAPPAKQSLTWHPEESMEKPELEIEYEPYSGIQDHLVKVGAMPSEFVRAGVRWIHGVDVRDEARHNDPWMRMCWINPDLEKVVTQDGYYRIRVKAGADPGNRREPVRLRLDYADGTPIKQYVDFEVTAPLEKPEIIETTLFLRRGDEGIQRRLEPWWNPDKELISHTKAHHQHVVGTTGLEEELVEAMERNASDEELNRLRAQLLENRQAAAKFKGPIQEFKGNAQRAPKLFVDWIKVDGPYPSGNAIYEPDIQSARFEAEQDRQGGMGIREPRATETNRFVTSEKLEVEAGAQRYRILDEGVLFTQGGDTYVRGNPWGRMATVTVDDLIPEDGYYRIRVRCGADRGTRDEPMKMMVSYNFKTPQELSTELPITATTDDPGVFEVVMFLRRGADDQRRKITLMFNDLRRYIVSTPEFNQLFQDTIGTVGKIQKARSAGDLDEAMRLEAFLKEARVRASEWKGPVRHINPEYADEEPPIFFLDWMEFEGPIQAEWPPKSHQMLLFDGDERQDLSYAREIFARFLPRAYRREVTPQEIDNVMQLVTTHFKATNDFHGSLRIGLQRVLTSPGFLFIQEPAQGTQRPLNDYELANRLSYFLWSSMPDAELFQLAQEGRLSDPATLKAQVDRLLADERAIELVENFGGQWLSVREFGSVMPAAEYRDYDLELEEASQREAYAFVEEVLRRNLPITTFLDSDFVMINERLAQHYGIEGVTGDHFRRVSLRPEHHRGGVLGMAGLMTLLSDGTRTLPVRRASWIVTNLFNDPPPPPPPNAGEVQPNTAGERLTVRERLERHRNEPTCASCHRTLDPFGLALENYDAIGKWRTQQNGEEFRGRNTPELNVSGTLPSGNSFSSLEEFKRALLEEKDHFAEAFSERMLTYALCRPVGYADRETIEDLMVALKEDEYRIQALIHAIVRSEAFRTK